MLKALPQAWWYSLLERSAHVGSIAPKAPFTCKSAVEFPVAFPLCLQVFNLLLALML